MRGDAGDAGLAKRIAGAAGVVVAAIGPGRAGGGRRQYLAQVRNLTETLGDARLLVVGGAGSLLADGRRLADDPGFPGICRAGALIVAGPWSTCAASGTASTGRSSPRPR